MFFDPMVVPGSGNPVIEALPWVIAAVLAVAGFAWIRRIIKDIEDN